MEPRNPTKPDATTAKGPLEPRPPARQKNDDSQGNTATPPERETTPASAVVVGPARNQAELSPEALGNESRPPATSVNRRRQATANPHPLLLSRQSTAVPCARHRPHGGSGPRQPPLPPGRSPNPRHAEKPPPGRSPTTSRYRRPSHRGLAMREQGRPRRRRTKHAGPRSLTRGAEEKPAVQPATGDSICPAAPPQPMPGCAAADTGAGAPDAGSRHRRRAPAQGGPEGADPETEEADPGPHVVDLAVGHRKPPPSPWRLLNVKVYVEKQQIDVFSFSRPQKIQGWPCVRAVFAQAQCFS
ncbi:basic proline-rich protein-like [Panicum virgatum]|uniref:basic proline-rich protein-like n=1 Tax=Panicum virgatum TaxID=38727 RepID=UPI0019D55A86|nr:basic proline-rich protein-like [Panicum virgatum]